MLRILTTVSFEVEGRLREIGSLGTPGNPGPEGPILESQKISS